MQLEELLQELGSDQSNSVETLLEVVDMCAPLWSDYREVAIGMLNYMKDAGEITEQVKSLLASV